MTTTERSKAGTTVLLTDVLVNVLVRLPLSIFTLFTRSMWYEDGSPYTQCLCALLVLEAIVTNIVLLWMTLRPSKNHFHLKMLLWYSFSIVAIISVALLVRGYNFSNSPFINPTLALLLFAHFTVLLGMTSGGKGFEAFVGSVKHPLNDPIQQNVLPPYGACK
jgi:hypothetical protein